MRYVTVGQASSIETSGFSDLPGCEALLAVLTRAQALAILRRAYGPEIVESLAGDLPDSIDLEDAADIELLSRLGISRDRLVNALGGEM